MVFNIISIGDVLDIFTFDGNSRIANKDLSKLCPNSSRYIFLARSNKNKVHKGNFLKGFLRPQYKKIKLSKETTYEQKQQAGWLPKRPAGNQAQERNFGPLYKQFGLSSNHTKPNKQPKLTNPFSLIKQPTLSFFRNHEPRHVTQPYKFN